MRKRLRTLSGASDPGQHLCHLGIQLEHLALPLSQVCECLGLGADEVSGIAYVSGAVPGEGPASKLPGRVAEVAPVGLIESCIPVSNILDWRMDLKEQQAPRRRSGGFASLRRR
jgi:hypothetical protein